MSTHQPRVVVVTRRSELELLLARHGTREQVRFFLAGRGLALEDVERRRDDLDAACRAVAAAIPGAWRRANVLREDLDRFLFAPEDVVVVVGQDGLVANVAKYVDGQIVLGFNPAPDAYEGVLVPHRPDAARELVRAAGAGELACEARTMVEARLDDGQRLFALNEVFVGHRSHQSARYTITHDAKSERQSSSGVVVATGTGASGWARSIHRERARPPALPAPAEKRLAFFVREAWPSVATGASITSGVLQPGEELRIVSEMGDDGVVFGDGIESDRLAFEYGRALTVACASRSLRFVPGAEPATARAPTPGVPGLRSAG